MRALTEYGKIVRHYRIDNQILLADMAKKLGMSSAYLSSIETGDRSIPANLTDKLCVEYSLSEQTRLELMKAEAVANKALTISFADKSDEEIEATVLFARELQNYSVEEIRAIHKKLKGEKNVYQTDVK